MLLPAMLRAKCPLIFVALYVRPPFPSSEVFRCLPQAREILAGMIGANIVGFQTSHYARHFISCCTRILGCETTPKSVDNSGLPVQVVSHPVGIDIDAIRRAIQREGVQQKVAFFREKYAGKRIILGLESIDQSKGILHKLAAMQRLLSDYPEWQGMVCPPLLSKARPQRLLVGASAPSRLPSFLYSQATQPLSRHMPADHPPTGRLSRTPHWAAARGKGD